MEEEDEGEARMGEEEGKCIEDEEDVETEDEDEEDGE